VRLLRRPAGQRAKEGVKREPSRTTRRPRLMFTNRASRIDQGKYSCKALTGLCDHETGARDFTTASSQTHLAQPTDASWSRREWASNRRPGRVRPATHGHGPSPWGSRAALVWREPVITLVALQCCVGVQTTTSTKSGVPRGNGQRLQLQQRSRQG
jgi:hypothetical protein